LIRERVRTGIQRPNGAHHVDDSALQDPADGDPRPPRDEYRLERAGGWSPAPNLCEHIHCDIVQPHATREWNMRNFVFLVAIALPLCAAPARG